MLPVALSRPLIGIERILFWVAYVALIFTARYVRVRVRVLLCICR